MSMQKCSNNCIHADSKKCRFSFLVALLFATGDARRYCRLPLCLQGSFVLKRIIWVCVAIGLIVWMAQNKLEL